MGASNSKKEKKSVCIIGAGAAGMATAWSLARHPEKFDVQVWEAAGCAGGVATSENVGKGGEKWINDGVQGAAPSYHNTLLLHKQVTGIEPHPIKFKVSFGKDATFWSNVVDTPLVLKMFRFSDEFCTQMVYPLTALFFGTGNQTSNCSSVIISRVFLDPDLRLFEYDEEKLLGETPDFFAFDKLHDIYAKMVENIPAKFCFNRAVEVVKRNSKGVDITDKNGLTEHFDEVVFACSAENALKMMEKTSFWERWALGHVKYYDDVTITHTDEAYMHKHYNVDKERGDQYFIRTLPQDPKLAEMSFDLGNYQAQLKDSNQPVYQTIFLDATKRHLWSIDEIDKDKIVLEKWWRQFAHVPGHFFFTVPFMRRIQGKQHSWFCGSYTLFNTHEMATISGLAVAERLGAPYPFEHDKLATYQFDTLLSLTHGARRSTKPSWFRRVFCCATDPAEAAQQK